eukprot:g17820.t1
MTFLAGVVLVCYSIFLGLVTVGRFDGKRPCLAGTAGKVLIHCPHNRIENPNEVLFPEDHIRGHRHEPRAPAQCGLRRGAEPCLELSSGAAAA